MRAKWNNHFAGNPSSLISKQDLLGLIEVPSECKDQAKTIWALVDQYGKAAYESDKKKIDLITGQLHSALAGSGECKDTLNQVYLLASTAIHPFDYTSKWFVTSTGDYAYVRVFPAVTASLLHHHKIVFLDDTSRQSFGGDWAKKNGSSYWINGAFACESGTIYIDPGSNPLDLAGVMMHELNHLYREKLVYSKASDDIFQFYATEGQTLDWDRINLADEASAIVQSALWQVGLKNLRKTREKLIYQMSSLQEDYLPNNPFLDVYHLARRASDHSNFQIGNDLSLFSKGGPLDSLFKEDLPLDASGLLASMGRQERNAAHSYTFSERSRNFSDTILTTIEQAYFPGAEKISSANPIALFYPELSINKTVEGLVSFGEFFPLGVTDTVKKLNHSQFEVVWTVTPSNGKPRFETGALVALMELLVPDENKPSQVCLAEEGDDGSGSLGNDYVGSHFPDPGLGANPSEKGTKPSEKGTKPSEKGTKPSEKGTKPSLHPCIDLSHQL